MSITFNFVPTGAAASAVFVEQEPVSRGTGSPVIPHKILIPGQYDSGKSPTDNIPQLILDLDDAWDRYGRGSLLSLLIEAALRKRGTVPIYALPLADAGAGVQATGTLVITGPASADGILAVYVGGVRIPVTVTNAQTATQIGDAVAAAITAALDLPVTAANVTGTVTFTVRWKGESGNQIKLEVNRLETDELPAGVGVTVTDIGDVVAGATNPVLDTALGNLGDVWYTDLVCPYLDATSLTAIKTSGDDRIDPGVKRPFAAFVGYTGTKADFLTKLGNLNCEWITLVPIHGSSTAGFEIGAAVTGDFAALQQATPGRPAKTRTISGVLAGLTNILTYDDRNTVVKAGGSHTYNQDDGTVTIGDLVTTRTETDGGADTTDWRFTIIIPNLQFKIYALENTFLASPFDQAVVLADGEGAGPTYTVRPSTVKTYAIALVDDWVARGLSTTRDTIVAGITSAIDGSNPGRTNLLIPDVPSAGLRILAAKLEWAYVV